MVIEESQEKGVGEQSEGVGIFVIALQDDAQGHGNNFFHSLWTQHGWKKKSYYRNVNNLGIKLSEGGKR